MARGQAAALPLEPHRRSEHRRASLRGLSTPWLGIEGSSKLMLRLPTQQDGLTSAGTGRDMGMLRYVSPEAHKRAVCPQSRRSISDAASPPHAQDSAELCQLSCLAPPDPTPRSGCIPERPSLPGSQAQRAVSSRYRARGGVSLAGTCSAPDSQHAAGDEPCPASRDERGASSAVGSAMAGVQAPVARLRSC